MSRYSQPRLDPNVSEAINQVADIFVRMVANIPEYSQTGFSMVDALGGPSFGDRPLCTDPRQIEKFRTSLISGLQGEMSHRWASQMISIDNHQPASRILTNALGHANIDIYAFTAQFYNNIAVWVEEKETSCTIRVVYTNNPAMNKTLIIQDAVESGKKKIELPLQTIEHDSSLVLNREQLKSVMDNLRNLPSYIDKETREFARLIAERIHNDQLNPKVFLLIATNILQRLNDSPNKKRPWEDRLTKLEGHLADNVPLSGPLLWNLTEAMSNKLFSSIPFIAQLAIGENFANGVCKILTDH